jgi:CO dehydrogenase/acetyl-CoA synthase epsilon subunit
MYVSYSRRESMSVKKPAWLAKHLKGKRLLILAGGLCDQIEMDNGSLVDYVVEIAKRTKAPVAPTGNTVNALKEKGVDVKKAWAIEMVNFTRYDWQHPIMEKRPQVMLLIGYSPVLAANLASAVQGVETIALGSTYVDAATYSLPDVPSFKNLKQELDDFLEALPKP